MKKLLFTLLILTSCKTSSHKCDAYGSTEEDVFKEHIESQKKYISFQVIK
jgi:hypothetical protein